MKILLTSLNSKFIHTNLAIRYFEAVLSPEIECEVIEYTINQRVEKITVDILKKEFDLLAFSAYIWKIEESLKVASVIKKARPEVKIIFGGPEASYDVKTFLEENDFVDFLLSGEGEESILELIKALQSNGDLDIRGLSYREGDQLTINDEIRLVEDLNIIPSPYKFLLDKYKVKGDDPYLSLKKEFENRIVYYESSRGCPFNCYFCLSSTIKKTRFFNIGRVKDDLLLLIKAGVGQVKFIDRTFNAKKEIFYDLLNFLIEKDNGNINFHFEIVASLLDYEQIDFLSRARKDLFQFEIGVQSTNEETILSVGRKAEFDKISKVVKKLDEGGNIHQHLDLIAGLPYEGYDRFLKSFDDVYELGAEKIQLGFLKLLKGSPIRALKDKYGYVFTDYPPYEVISNKFITYKEIIKLKEIEETVEIYLTDSRFKKTLSYAIEKVDRASKFFEEFTKYRVQKGYADNPLSLEKHYTILKDFLNKKYPEDSYINSLIIFDFLTNTRNTKTPKGLEFETVSYQATHDTLREIINKEIFSFSKGDRVKEEVKFSRIVKFSPSLKEKDIKGEYILFKRVDKKIEYYDVTEIVEGLNECD